VKKSILLQKSVVKIWIIQKIVVNLQCLNKTMSYETENKMDEGDRRRERTSRRYPKLQQVFSRWISGIALVRSTVVRQHDSTTLLRKSLSPPRGEAKKESIL
jgi:hypothetical protein